MFMTSSKIFKALSDKNRMKILQALKIKMLCVCEIRALLNLANSTVSQHLKILKEAGFIIELKDGKWVNYMINPHPADNRISEIINNLDFWLGEEFKEKITIKKVESLDRKIICCV
ncbi:MAG: metalloregulator ArsR/SmtB family transcription factor [Melioribacteraceae bacterium]|nr:metalloregulator ArsR/SmtB family transcription factor [Melioribacteraceae bacterium]